MNPKRACLSALQLFSAALFFAASLFFFALPFADPLRLKIAEAVIVSSRAFFSIGAGLLCVSLILTAVFYDFNRGKRLRVAMKNGPVSIGSDVLRKTLEECFQKNFPHQVQLSDLDIPRGKRIEIEVRMSAFEENFREELFVSLEKRSDPF